MSRFRSKVKSVDDDDDDDDSSACEIEDHMSEALAGIRKLKQRHRTLLRENNSLKLELESKSASNETHYRRSPLEDGSESSEMRVRELEKTVKALKEENFKQKRSIEKYKSKQLRAEAADLLVKNSDANSDHDEEMDPEYRMRKLLRKFSDLMLVTTLPDECPICYENLKLGSCSAFPCEHTVCNSCLPGISKGADETVLCPVCRARHPRDDVELVHMTETQRWDELLKVAQAWDAFDADTRGELETSEEEAEENFLTDGDGMTENSSEMERGSERQDPSSEPEASTPPPVQRQAYSQSPTKLKRRILEELVEARDTKRRK